MNKKLLFGIMSLAALAACTTDEFESQQKVAENVSPIQFELVNDNDALTRASMNDANKVVFSASDGDLFTLYHGGTVSTNLTNYQNATYKASTGEGGIATLTTPSMILQGSAIMVWPVDTTFRIGSGDILSIVIPQVLEAKTESNKNGGIENQIPYVSDLINIQAFSADASYNTAGYNRTYPIYMRQMASQLTIKADYAGTDATIAQLYDGGSAGLTGDDAIGEISVNSVELNATTEKFTTKIPLNFTAKTTGDGSDDDRWNNNKKATYVANNAWSHVTGFGEASAKVAELTTKCLIADNGGAKFLVLPQIGRAHV